MNEFYSKDFDAESYSRKIMEKGDVLNDHLTELHKFMTDLDHQLRKQVSRT